ncbi:TonB-dependent receptor domain-containing protein [Vibrio splendidus]|uniref:TonB-dependent receptor domain-containing protein n=1 Tax=Vibrio splendidus TaxID=29497 RepID=UPI000E32B66F|nr:TonB-dependent receptor [Vibrio splendidus]
MKNLHLAPLGAVFLCVGGAYASETTDEVMVVTATSYQTRASEAPATVSVITQEQLALMPYTNLTDALINTAGVNIADVGHGRKGVEIRGMDVSQSLILVDGRRISRASDMLGHSNFELQNIPVSDIERIEVIKGPMSALYGSDALGGVVNVITTRTSNEWTGRVRGGGATAIDEDGNTANIEVGASGALIDDKLLMKITAGHTYQGLIENRNRENETDIAGNRNQFVDLDLKAILTPEQELDFYTRIAQTESWYDSNDAATDRKIRSTTTYDSLDYGVTHSGYWGFGDTQLRVYGSRVSQDNEKNIGPANTANDVDEDIVDGYVQFFANDDHNVTVGGQWSEQRLSSNDITTGGGSADQGALFLQDDISLTSELSLLLGVRYDNHSDFGSHTSPRAYLVYNPTQNWTFKGGYGEGFKAPTIKQLSPDYLSVGTGRPFDIRGNADLKPEVNKSYELSAAYNTDRWGSTVTLFQNDVENLIELECVEGCGRPQPGVTLYEYVNVAEAEIKGLEWAANVNLSSSWFVNMNLTLLDTEDKSTGKAIDNKPESQAYLAINWRTTEQLTTQASVRHVGKQTDDEEELPAYQVYDLAANYRLQSVDLSMGISNVFDTYLEDESEFYTYAIQPRQVYLNGTYKF